MEKARILVIEDDAISLKIYKILLERWGYEVQYASDGYLGFQMIQSQHYDLILTDNQLPFMSCEELFDKLRIAFPNLPVMIISGEAVNTANELTRIFLKPIAPEELRILIHKNLVRTTLKKSA